MTKKGFIIALGLLLGISVGSCRQSTDPDLQNPDRIELSKTPINLGLTSIHGQTSGALGVNSRAKNEGTIIEHPDLLLGENVALYGVREQFQTGALSWNDRMISTTTAQLEKKSIDYLFNYGATSYYPEGGFLNVYALYPVDVPYVQLTDDNTSTPFALISLGVDFASQYDVLYGKTERLTVAQAQQAKITFDHALAQLRLNIYRDPALSITPTLTKVVVRGVSKATLADMASPLLTPSTNVLDSLDFVAFTGSLPLTATDKTSAHVLNVATPLMLIPGLASISKITVTVDGNEFTTYIPENWELKQSKVNTATLLVKQFGLRLETPWVVTPWGSGQAVDEGVENNGQMIRISANLIDALSNNLTTYNGTRPTSVDLTIGDYTHKNIQITSYTDGVTSSSVPCKVLTTALFNSGSLNDNQIDINGLTIRAGATILFDAKLENGTLQSGSKIYIDQTNNGLLKRLSNNSSIDLVMGFGGFGRGTAVEPYEVSTPAHLLAISKFMGSSGSSSLNGTPTGGAAFKQVDHLDLSAIADLRPIGLTGTTNTPFYGWYNGNNKEIHNLNITLATNNHIGLFGSVYANTVVNSGVIQNVVLASGAITSTHVATSGTSVGGIVGYLYGGKVIQCINKATVTGKSRYVGGVVGNMLLSGASVNQSVNMGTVSTDHTVAYLGGVVGFINYVANTPPVVNNCYNTGEVKYVGSSTTAAVGGIVGSLSPNALLSNSYNRGKISNAISATTQTGSIIGSTVSGRANAATANLHGLDTAYEQPIGTPKLIGTDASTSGFVSTKATSQTQAGLKSLAPTLGASWKADYTTNPINEGFPILSWQ